jgi:predicted alpha/beta superfamily hydrolase
LNSPAPSPFRAIHFFIALLLVFFVNPAHGENHNGGTILDESVPSQIFGSPRTVHIYLPPEYSETPAKRFPVLYLHDGQNVFSTAGTNIAFGWGNWELDLTADRLVREKKMRPIIMVAVDNWGAARMREYSGHHSSEANTNASFDNYSAFLVRELKPYIDRKFRTLPEAAHTGLMGSSLGGLCSAVMAWEHPEVFGNAASLSGSFSYDNKHFFETLKAHQGPQKSVKFYFDSGTVDYSGGDDGRRMTAAVVGELNRIGWRDNLQLFVDEHPPTTGELSASGLRRDKWTEAQTNQHNEFYWRQRAWRPLTFLFPPVN